MYILDQDKDGGNLTDRICDPNILRTFIEDCAGDIIYYYKGNKNKKKKKNKKQVCIKVRDLVDGKVSIWQGSQEASKIFISTKFVDGNQCIAFIKEVKEKTLDGTYVKSIESQEYAIVKEDQILLFFADLNKML